MMYSYLELVQLDGIRLYAMIGGDGWLNLKILCGGVEEEAVVVVSCSFL